MVRVHTCRAEHYITGILLNHLLMVDHPAPKDADCESFLTLHFSAALGGIIHGGLLTGHLTGRCHLCKPDLERHEIDTALSVCFVCLVSSGASLCTAAELVAASPEHNGF